MTLCARGQWEPWTQVLLSRQRAGKDGDLCGLVKEVLVSDGGFVRTAGLHGDMKPPFGEETVQLLGKKKINQTNK